jgi:saccharopine dehydrogenase-like NADP-dependent oxidoreductase
VLPFQLNINDHAFLSEEISRADIVVSLLPAAMHPLLIEPCLEHKKHLLTASYTSDAMKSASEAAVAKGVLFLNEMGLDPGIDHMSCMQVRIEFHFYLFSLFFPPLFLYSF